MNCKPGDKAVIVRDPKRRDIFEGALLRVLVIESFSLMGDAMWVFEPISQVLVDRLANFPGDTICDLYLRPIRDPGDDAVDETLEWLPVPSHTKETA